MQTVTLSNTEQEIIKAVSVDRLMADTAAIARWVRLSGSQEERQAFEYVAGVVSTLGVEPKLHFAPGYISLPESAEVRVNDRDIPAITHAMAASTGPEGVRLALEYVGAGTPDDYGGRDVRGKAVLVDGMAMPGKVQTAERAGAAACVFTNRDAHMHEMIVSTVWGSPTPQDRPHLPCIPVVTIGRTDGDALCTMLGRGRSAEVHLVAHVSTQWREIPTLIAQVDGVQEPEKFVLLSGHIDSWHYGAMDNGSANATMLETLRVTLPYRNTFQRSLRLAFWSGHSHGRYAGSTWYADTFWEDLHDNCVVHLNVDSVGGRNATVLTEAHAMAETRSVAADVIRAVTGVGFSGTRFGRAGDQSFQSHGIPSLFMSLSEQPPAEGDAAQGFAELVGGEGAKSGGLGWWWHTPEDTIDKIDPVLLARDTQIYAAVTYRFLAERILPLDLLASAEDLLAHLRAWQQRADGRFDLKEAISRAEEVTMLAEQLQGRLASAGQLSPRDQCRLNDAIMAAERPLVRLNYVQSDPYSHDPALGQPPVPALAPIDQLVRAAPGSTHEYELRTLLVRRRNRILHELAEARRALQEGLQLLTPP